MAHAAQTDIMEFLGSDLHEAHPMLPPDFTASIVGPDDDPRSSYSSSTSFGQPIPSPLLDKFSLSQLGLDHLAPMATQSLQCEKTVEFLQNSIVERVKERAMQAFFVQRDILARHPKIAKWPIFVQEFIAGPMANLIAMAELHKTIPQFDAAAGHKIVDRLIWSTRLSAIGPQRGKLIEMLPGLKEELCVCAEHLGIKRSSDPFQAFLGHLQHLHFDLIDASSHMAKAVRSKGLSLDDVYKRYSQMLNAQYPSMLQSSSGEERLYIWPSIWLTPAESTIDATLQMSASAAPAHPRTNALFDLDDRPDKEPLPRSTTRLKRLIAKLLPRRKNHLSYKAARQNSQTSASTLRSGPDVTTDDQLDNEQVMRKTLKRFESSEGKHYFYLKKKDGSGWDKVKLSWSNKMAGKPASMFAVTAKNGAMLTMSRRQLTSLIEQNGLKEFLHTMPNVLARQ